jgi:hypothetical protein
MLDQMIDGTKFDMLAISTETLHQVEATLDDSRPSRELVEDLIDDVVRDAIEEVLAVNESSQRASNQIEVGADGLVGCVLAVRHVLYPCPVRVEEILRLSQR